MMKSGPRNKDDVLALLVRRRWWIGVPFLALAAAVSLLTYLVPSLYVSEAFVQVRPRDVPEEYVPDLLATTAQQRLIYIEQTVLSRGNMVEIANQFDPRLPEMRRLNMDQRIERLRDQIDIEFFTEPGPGGPILTAFTVAYQNRDPELAREITQQLTTRFVASDAEIREDQVGGTSEFLETEYEKALEELEASDRELEELRRTYQNSLPEQMTANQQELNLVRQNLQRNEADISQATSTLMALNLKIAETPPTLPLAERRAVPIDPKVAQLEQARNYLETVSILYTENHPEVQRAREAVAAYEAELPPEPEGEGDVPEEVPPPVNPAWSNLRADIQAAQTQLEFLTNRRALYESELQRINANIQRTFATEPIILEAYRRNESAREHYEGLRQMRQEAGLAQTLEFRQQAGQFRIVEPANVPLNPEKPSKPLVLLAGLLASLALSVAFALAVDVATQKIWTQSEIENQWGVPVLIDIPEIVTDSDQAQLRKRRLVLGVSFAGAAAAYTLCLYLVYLKQDFVLQRLDPLIQGLIY